jgi:cell division protein FtsQ
MAGSAEKRKKERKVNRGGIYRPVAILISIVAVLFSISIFFKVTEIHVTGNDIYSAEEIIGAAGIEEGDNLFFVSASSAAAEIKQGLPYIEEVKITKSYPSIVRIEITESYGTAAIYADGAYWITDASGKVLDKVNQSGTEGLITITGLDIQSPEIGKTITADTGDVSALQYVKDALKVIESNDLIDDIYEIDVTNISNMTLNYQGKFTVKMGTNENLEYKFRMLISSVEQLTSYDGGTLDLTAGNEAHFKPAD